MKVVKSATELLNEEEIIERTKKKTVLARATRFAAVLAEVTSSSIQQFKSDAANVTYGDKVAYYIENKMAASSSYKFYLLALVIFILWSLMTVIWRFTSGLSNDAPDSSRLLISRGGSESAAIPGDNWLSSWYYVFIVLMTGAVDTTYDVNTQFVHTLVFLICIALGLGVFAVLVGFVNETVTAYIDGINQGRSKVATSGHTLILGWNESTLRVVCQIAFLRRAFLQQNETWARTFLWWTRTAPSTPVSVSPVVLLCNTMTKADMDEQLTLALEERGIDPRRTRIGEHIICRVGDPTDPTQLMRAGAHRATSILVMLTELDREEEAATDGLIKGGATMSALLALRFVMFNSDRASTAEAWTDFRCVVHKGVDVKVDGVDVLETVTFTNYNDEEVVTFVDIQRFVNQLMMTCAIHPGLSAVFMELLTFEGVAFRSKKATDAGVVGMTMGDLRFHFNKAVVVGVADTSKRLDPQKPEKDNGIACSHTRVITENDRIVIRAVFMTVGAWAWGW